MKSRILCLIMICLLSFVGCNNKEIVEEYGLKHIKTFSLKEEVLMNQEPTGNYTEMFVIVARDSNNFDPNEITEEMIIKTMKQSNFPSKYNQLIIFIMPEEFNKKVGKQLKDLDSLLDDSIYLFEAEDFAEWYPSNTNDDPRKVWFEMSSQEDGIFEGTISKSRIK